MVSEEHCVVLFLEQNDSDANIVMQSFASVDVPHELRRVSDCEAMLVYLKESLNKGSSDKFIKPRLIVFGIERITDDVVKILEFLQKDNELKRVPVLVFSRASDNDSILRAYQLKVNSYLLKPDDREEFANVAREVGGYWLRWNQLPS
jgi:response regulator RpfG family c-di-GMP phosphodiesterase